MKELHKSEIYMRLIGALNNDVFTKKGADEVEVFLLGHRITHPSFLAIFDDLEKINRTTDETVSCLADSPTLLSPRLTTLFNRVKSLCGLRERPFTIAICGGSGVGRSTLVRALTEEGMLLIRSATMRPVILGTGAVTVDSSVEANFLEQGEFQGISLMELPATEMLMQQPEAVEQCVIADLVLLVISIEKGTTESDMLFLDDLLHQWGRNVIVIINKADLVSVRDGELAKEKFSATVAPILQYGQEHNASGVLLATYLVSREMPESITHVRSEIFQMLSAPIRAHARLRSLKRLLSLVAEGLKSESVREVFRLDCLINEKVRDLPPKEKHSDVRVNAPHLGVKDVAQFGRCSAQLAQGLSHESTRAHLLQLWFPKDTVIERHLAPLHRLERNIFEGLSHSVFLNEKKEASEVSAEVFDVDNSDLQGKLVELSEDLTLKTSAVFEKAKARILVIFGKARQTAVPFAITILFVVGFTALLPLTIPILWFEAVIVGFVLIFFLAIYRSRYLGELKKELGEVVSDLQYFYFLEKEALYNEFNSPKKVSLPGVDLENEIAHLHKHRTVLDGLFNFI
jgi:GTP-binding protein EngB required for normal cell division